MLEFDEGIVAPKLHPEAFASHHLARPFQERHQDLEGFFGNPYLDAGLVNLAGSRVNIDATETIAGHVPGLGLHLDEVYHLVHGFGN